MQRKVKSRFKLIIFCMMLCATGTYTILYNLEKNIVFFYPPSKINEVTVTQEFRVGGVVKSNSIVKISPNKVHFIITDNIKDLKISYQGILPALFREQQGIIAIGKLSNNIFIARELLIKHDENYFPELLKNS